MNECYWLSIKEFAYKIRKIKNHKLSYLWAISQQISEIEPTEEAFNELPGALLQDLKSVLEVRADDAGSLVPGRRLWEAVAKITNRTIVIVDNVGQVERIESGKSKEEVIKLFVYRKDQHIQVDSIETVTQSKEILKEGSKKNIGKVYDQKVIKVASLNVRGCCEKQKKEEIDEVLIETGVDTAVLQEVNINGNKINAFNFEWFVSDRKLSNKSRGLAILKNKNVNVEIKNIRNVNKNIMSAIIEFDEGKNQILVINVHGTHFSLN